MAVRYMAFAKLKESSLDNSLPSMVGWIPLATSPTVCLFPMRKALTNSPHEKPEHEQ
jgi:hypothetical protein